MSERPTFSVVVAGWRHRTLPRALASIAAQEGGDGPAVEVVVVGDAEHPEVRAAFERSAAGRPTWRYLEAADPGGWGYPKKQLGLESATGDYVVFLDDDDVYVDGALAAFRVAVAAAPASVHLFRIDRIGRVYWRTRDVRQGNVSSQGAVVPNVPGKVGSMTAPLRYESDFDFISRTIELQGPPIWHDRIVVISNPPDWLPWRRRRSTNASRRLDRLRDGARVRTRIRAAARRLRRSTG